MPAENVTRLANLAEKRNNKTITVPITMYNLLIVIS